MSLIVNSKMLPLNPVKGHELEEYSREYQDGLNALKTRFPSGSIVLKRAGFPKPPKQSTNDLILLPEEAPPIFMKLTRSVNGVSWAYCRNAPKTEANGLVSVPVNDNSELLQGDMISLDLKKNPDYTFFFWFKSGQIGTNFSVYEPEADRMRELKEKQERIRVQSLIWADMDETKFKMVCQAWGITLKDKSTKEEKPMEVLRQEMEDKVFKGEEKKQKDKTDLMARGIAEFLADIKADEFTRPKALIQYAIEEGRIVYDKKNGHYYFEGADICFVPYGHQDPTLRQEFLAKFLRNTDNVDMWLSILKALVNKDYIEKCDKYGKRYLAGQVGIALNQKEEDLTSALLEYFGT